MAFEEIRPENDEDWLKLRTEVITASDMGVLLGLNKWKSVSELVEGKKKFEPFENAYTWLGQALEPVVVLATNKVLGTNFRLFENGSRSFFMDTDLKLGATPDAGEGDILLECKTTKPGNYLRWHGWPPAYYLSQLYVQLYCTNRQTGLLAVMSTNLSHQTDVLNLPIHVHELRRSPEIDAILIQEVNRFWECQKVGKLYRVNRKQAPGIEMKLRCDLKRIYG
jgi:hypothetical protein